jgi:RND family efflux transporter MFP subunit
LIGQIRARDEINLAFRIDGKLLERTVNLGDRINVGRLVARLDSQNEQNALQGADADIAAAQAAFAQAEKLEARQADLLRRNITSRAVYDQALQQLQTAQAQLDSAQARHRTNHNRLKFTELETEVGGIVTAKGAEPGEFVRAGQMIVKVAREHNKDAVFELPAQLALSGRVPMDPIIHVALVDNPNIKTTGRIREVSPQADPVTRLFPVKVGLDNPPPEFFLGVTVSGAVSLEVTSGHDASADGNHRIGRQAVGVGGRSGQQNGRAACGRDPALRSFRRYRSERLAGRRGRGHRRR